MIRQLVALTLIFVAASITAIADEDVDNICQKISRKLASVGYEECATLNMSASGHYSIDGIPLLVKEYPPLKSRKPQGRILLVGGTHGDELSSISIVFKYGILSPT